MLLSPRLIPRRVCREVVTDLIEEYKAAERPDYVTWGGSQSSTTYVPNSYGEDMPLR